MTNEQHPISQVKWVDPTTLRANHYNPNKVFGTEYHLLKISILEDGWTQPIVILEDGTIVDGFHRWTLGSTDEDIRKLSGGLVPVVMVKFTDTVHKMMSTVRHNRARGKHGVLRMGDIVRTLVDEGLTEEQIMVRLQMDREEFTRLVDAKGSPLNVGKDSFGKGWIPTERMTPDQAAEHDRKRGKSVV